VDSLQTNSRATKIQSCVKATAGVETVLKSRHKKEVNFQPMEQRKYGGHIIHFIVEKESDSEFWNARGYIERIDSEGGFFHNVSVPTNTFTTEEDARQAFFAASKQWIDAEVTA
jgi:hypothetical protein